MEELASTTDDAAEGKSSRRRGAQARNYSDAALAENLPRVSDLIPTRWWLYAVFLLASIVAIVGLEYLYLGMETWGESIGHENLAAFDPRRRGSLAGWFSSFTLGLAFGASCLVFAIRRHKTDDYRGRYRMWLWVPVVLLAGSLDATTGVREVLAVVLHQAAGKFAADSFLATHAASIWSIGGALLLLAAAVRVAIEIRRSRAAVSFLSLAIAAYVTMALIAFQVLWHELGSTTVVMVSATKLAGDVALLFASLSYARYVYMDAQGLIGIAKPKAKKARGKAADQDAKANGDDQASSHDAASTKNAEPKRTDLDTVSKTTESREAAKSGPLASFKKSSEPTKPSAASSAASQDDDDDDDLGDEEDDKGLTRAERKRQKKLAKQNGRRAA